MAQWIRWWGVGVFAAIILFWWLCIDVIAKAVIETMGTEVNGAKVELSSVELTLFPASLTLNNLQVTDSNAPMSNLLEAKIVTASLDSLELFGRKIIADDMTVSGLQFNTPRKTSGAIKGRVLSKEGVFNADNLNIGSAIPGLTLPDTDSLVKAEKQTIKNEYDQINNELKNLETQWKQRIDELPDKQKIEEYKQRIKKIKKGNFLEKLAGIKSIKEDIDKDRNNIKTLDDQLKRDLDKVKSEINRAKQLPEQQINRMLSKLGLGDNALDGIASGIMSGEIKQRLQQGLSMIKGKEDSSASDEPQQPEKQRGTGTWVSFSEQQPLPQVLIRNATLNGVFEIADQNIDFTGNAKNLTHQPDKWHKPATFTIDASSNTNASIAVNGILDHRTKDNIDTIDFQINEFPLSNYLLSGDSELTVLAKNALANIDGKLKLKGTTLDLDVNSLFNKVALEVSSDKSNTLVSTLISTLQSVEAFNLTLKLTGPIDNPNAKVRSDLDKLLGKALGASINEQKQALKQKLTAQLQSQLAPDLQGITQKGDLLSGFSKQLGEKQAEFKGLTKGL